MKNILLVNFKRHGDIISTTSLINSIKVHYPQSHISLLVYKQFEKSASLIEGINKLWTIDRDRLLLTSKNEIFSNALVLDTFYNSVEGVCKESWHEIINISNDSASTSFCSYLKQKNQKAKVFGIHKDSNNTIIHSDFYSKVMNEIWSDYDYTPFHLSDLLHKIVDLPLREGRHQLIQDENFQNVANSNFAKIRESLSTSKPKVKFIGIQLSSSSIQKDISKEVLFNLIEKIYSSPVYHPIILSSPSEQDRKLCQEITSEFNNSIITIEAEFKAITSVLSNLDAVITPDTAIKHFCDLAKVKTLELNFNYVPFNRQGSTNPESLILSYNSLSYDEQMKFMINSDVIFEALNVLMGLDPINFKFDSNICLYRPIKSQNKISYTCIAGKGLELIYQIEISRFFFEYINDQKNLSELDRFQIDQNFISTWTEEAKEDVKHVTRLLLHTLRTIMQARENQLIEKEIGKFLYSLLSHCSENKLSSILVCLFRSDIENSLNPEEDRLDFLEKKLYNLKTNLQKLSSLLKKIESLHIVGHSKIAQVSVSAEL